MSALTRLSTRSLRSHLGTAAIVAAGIGILAGAACGSGATSPGVAAGGSGAAGGPSPIPTDPARLSVQIAQCLRAHGASEPDPVVDDTGTPHWQVPLDSIPFAQKQACLPLLQAAQQLATKPPRLSPAVIAEERTFAQCMRARGIPLADPDPGSGQLKHTGIDENDPTVQAAITACEQQAGVSTAP